MQNMSIDILEDTSQEEYSLICEFIHRLYLSRPFFYVFISSWRENIYVAESRSTTEYNAARKLQILQFRRCRLDYLACEDHCVLCWH